MCRLWTSGYDFFIPPRNVIYHLWTRSYRPTFREVIFVEIENKKKNNEIAFSKALSISLLFSRFVFCALFLLIIRVLFSRNFFVRNSFLSAEIMVECYDVLSFLLRFFFLAFFLFLSSFSFFFLLFQTLEKKIRPFRLLCFLSLFFFFFFLRLLWKIVMFCKTSLKSAFDSCSER